MNRISAIVTSVLSINALTFVLPPIAYAEDAADLEMSKYQFSSMVTADNVYVRSGSSENDYPIVKLGKGDVVVAVGGKFDWVKILPPDGTFCLVGKAWIEKRGDGTVGRVRDDSSNVNVRVASNINNMITKVALQLHGGSDVKILGEQDEYFKIAPPAGTFMWVHKKFLEPVKRVEVVNNNGALEVKPVEGPDGAVIANTPKVGETPTNTLPDRTTLPGDTTTSADPKTVDPTAMASNNPSPSTLPAGTTSAGEKAFDALEAKFDESSKLALEAQPIDELLGGYEKLIADKSIPESMLRLAEFRVKGLKIRKEALVQFNETKKLRDTIAAETKPLEAEGTEIKERLADTKIKQFTATGTLRQSALPYGGRTLYRLTDPASGRTVVYVNSNDPNVVKLEGLFIGIRGEVVEDAGRRIKFIQPNEVEQIDPQGLVKGTVISTLTPASLMPTAAASAGKPD